MTEKEKMERGELFDPEADAEMRLARRRCAALCHEYNRTAPWEAERRGELLRQLTGRLGEERSSRLPSGAATGTTSPWGKAFTRTTTSG